jgi:hypothetical protein
MKTRVKIAFGPLGVKVKVTVTESGKNYFRTKNKVRNEMFYNQTW